MGNISSASEYSDDNEIDTNTPNLPDIMEIIPPKKYVISFVVFKLPEDNSVYYALKFNDIFIYYDGEFIKIMNIWRKKYHFYLNLTGFYSIDNRFINNLTNSLKKFMKEKIKTKIKLILLIMSFIKFSENANKIVERVYSLYNKIFEENLDYVIFIANGEKLTFHSHNDLDGWTNNMPIILNELDSKINIGFHQAFIMNGYPGNNCMYQDVTLISK